MLTPTPVPPGQFPLFSGVRVFDSDYKNPRIYAFNVGYEQELMPDLAGYVDFTWTEGRNLTRFLNYNRSGPSCCDRGPGTGNTYVYTGTPCGPQLGEVMVTNSLRRVALPRPHARRPQALLAAATSSRRNYVLSKDEDDDSNERDPFTDRSFNFFDLTSTTGRRTATSGTSSTSSATSSCRAAFSSNARMQGRTAQPITPVPRVLNGVDRGRNRERKDNEFFSFDWRLARPFRLGGGVRDHADDRDVQHVQQRQQHQPAVDAGAVQLRRVPADRRRRSAPGAAGGEGDVLTS